jgi:hypothetical protein
MEANLLDDGIGNTLVSRAFITFLAAWRKKSHLRGPFIALVRTGRETAGTSTALRSGRDDNSVAPLAAIRLNTF